MGPYVVLTEEYWSKLKDKIRRLNSDLISEMELVATPIELDNHHNASLCPYCTPRSSQLIQELE